MKILFPDICKSDSVENVWLEIFNVNSFKNFLINKDIFKKQNYIEISDNFYKESHSFRYKILNKNNEINFYNYDKRKIMYKGLSHSEIKCLRKNYLTSYLDNEVGASLCLKDLHVKIAEANSITPTINGSKNLIYYSVYFDTGYVDLFHLSIETIIKHSNLNFDVLIITDEETQNLIKKLKFSKKINFKFLLTSTPKDGVAASFNKLKIFSYKDIDSYKKILFLDCDIMAIKNIQSIFKKELKPNTLYTAQNSNIDFKYFQSIHHGFECLPDSFVQETYTHNQLPLNAGQFLFLNDSCMKKHFQNLLWFISEWPLEYFFEQSFMCYYFAKGQLCSHSFLSENVSLISVREDIEYLISDSTCLLHFISPPLNATAKKKFIINYFNSNNYFIPFFINISFWKKIHYFLKRWFKKIFG